MIRKLTFLLCFFLFYSCTRKDDLIGDYYNNYGQKLSIKKNRSYRLYDLNHSMTYGRWKIVENGQVLFSDWIDDENKKGYHQVTFNNETLWFSPDDADLNFRKVKMSEMNTVK